MRYQMRKTYSGRRWHLFEASDLICNWRQVCQCHANAGAFRKANGGYQNDEIQAALLCEQSLYYWERGESKRRIFDSTTKVPQRRESDL